MSTEYEKLKTLLFKDEMADLSAFRQLLNDDDALAKKLSQVLNQASDLTLKSDPRFKEKFTPSNPEIYLSALKKDPKGLMALLTPIISPAIRSAVLQTMRRFISEVNNKLEMGFSFKALKWRWQAFRTGVPFSEILFENTIQYQVQQLLLIEKETGLLVEYAGMEESLAQDKEAMSAMLTAIQDFVSDSLSSDTGTLSAAELGDDVLWVFPGSEYNLAVLIKGAPSGRLRDQLADLLSQIHIKYAQDFKDQNTWNNHLAARHDLSEHLIQKDIQTEKHITLWPWLLISVLLLSWLAFHHYQKQQKIDHMWQQINATPGLAIDHLELAGDQFLATGFKDPLTDVSLLQSVQFNTQAFYSMDEALIIQRAASYVNDPSIKLNFSQGTLTLNGQTNNKSDWSVLKLIPGISKVLDLTQKPVDLTDLLTQFLTKNPPDEHLSFEVKAQQIWVTGETLASDWESYQDLLQNAFTSINTDAVELIPSRSSLIHSISNQPVLIKNLSQLDSTNKAQLQQIITWNHQLTKFHGGGVLTLHAKSDCQGSIEESIENNQRRLAMVQAYLQQSGVDTQQTQALIDSCESITETVDPNKIGVWFEIK